MKSVLAFVLLMAVPALSQNQRTSQQQAATAVVNNQSDSNIGGQRLTYDIKTKRPVLSKDILVARQQVFQYCKDLISEYEAVLLKEAHIKDEDSPFKTYCANASGIINKVTIVGGLHNIVGRIEERANQIVFYEHAKSIFQFISKYNEAEARDGNIFDQLSRLRRENAFIKEQLADAPKGSSHSLFEKIGLNSKSAQQLEGILILLNLLLTLFLLKRT